MLAVASLVALAHGSIGCDTSRNVARQRVAEGVQFANNGDNLEAVRRLEEAIAADPDNGQAHYFAGLIRLQHYQDPGRAVPSLERAVELMPADAEARYQLGVALERVGQSDRAAARYAETISLDAEHAGALYRAGALQEARGMVLEAIDLYTRAIYADPRFGHPYNALGNLYDRYGRPDEAVAVFRNAVANAHRTDRESIAAKAANLADLGRVLVGMGRLDEAVEALEQAAESDRSSASIPLNLGVALSRRFEATGNTSDREAAIEALTRARAMCDPAAEQARCNSIASTLRDLRAAAAQE